MYEKLKEVCEEILGDETKTKEFLLVSSIEEMYNFFKGKIPNLSTSEFDDFIAELLENYERMQLEGTTIDDEILQNVSGGAKFGSKITAASLAFLLGMPAGGAPALATDGTNKFSAAMTNVGRTISNTSSRYGKWAANTSLAKTFPAFSNWLEKHPHVASVVSAVLILAAIAGVTYGTVKLKKRYFPGASQAPEEKPKKEEGKVIVSEENSDNKEEEPKENVVDDGEKQEEEPKNKGKGSGEEEKKEEPEHVEDGGKKSVVTVETISTMSAADLAKLEKRPGLSEEISAAIANRKRELVKEEERKKEAARKKAEEEAAARKKAEEERKKQQEALRKKQYATSDARSSFLTSAKDIHADGFKTEQKRLTQCIDDEIASCDAFKAGKTPAQMGKIDDYVLRLQAAKEFLPLLESTRNAYSIYLSAKGKYAALDARQRQNSHSKTVSEFKEAKQTLQDVRKTLDSFVGEHESELQKFGFMEQVGGNTFWRTWQASDQY